MNTLHSNQTGIRAHTFLKRTVHVYPEAQKFGDIEIHPCLKQMTGQVVAHLSPLLIVIIVGKIILHFISSATDTHGHIFTQSGSVSQIAPIGCLRQIEIIP